MSAAADQLAMPVQMPPWSDQEAGGGARHIDELIPSVGWRRRTAINVWFALRRLPVDQVVEREAGVARASAG